MPRLDAWLNSENVTSVFNYLPETTVTVRQMKSYRGAPDQKSINDAIIMDAMQMLEDEPEQSMIDYYLGRLNNTPSSAQMSNREHYILFVVGLVVKECENGLFKDCHGYSEFQCRLALTVLQHMRELATASAYRTVLDPETAYKALCGRMEALRRKKGEAGGEGSGGVAGNKLGNARARLVSKSGAGSSGGFDERGLAKRRAT